MENPVATTHIMSGSDDSDGDLDQMIASSSSSSGSSAKSFFESLDRQDMRSRRHADTGKRKAGKAESTPMSDSKTGKPQWVQTCDIHKGEWVDTNVRLPDPCPQCKKADGHGQKARVFEMPVQAGKEGDQIQFDAEFMRQQEKQRSHPMQRLKASFRN
jgi:hypothetical protein